MRDDFIHIADLKKFFKKRVKLYISLGICCGSIACLAGMMYQPKYYLEASFKEASVRQDSSTSLLKTLLKNPVGIDLGLQALSVMKSTIWPARRHRSRERALRLL